MRLVRRGHVDFVRVASAVSGAALTDPPSAGPAVAYRKEGPPAMYVKESPMPTDLLAARVFQIPGPDQPTATPDTATSHPSPVPPTPFSSAAAPQATPSAP